MTTNLNPNFIKWLLQVLAWGLILFFIFMLIFSWVSCNPIKKETRLNNKAFGRVVTNDTLLQAAGLRAFKAFGGSDTTTEVKRGKIDSTTIGSEYLKQHPEILSALKPTIQNITLSIDTTKFKNEFERKLAQSYADSCNEKIKKSFDLGFDEGKNEAFIAVSKLKIPIPATDTLVNRIRLKGLENIYQQTINNQHTKLGYQDGRIDALTQDKKDLQKRNTILYLIIAAIIVLCILSHILRSKLSTIKLPFKL